MRHFIALVALTGVCLAGLPATAQELRPIEAYSLHLGSVNGNVYYDRTGADDTLVATLSATPDSSPIRIVTTLGPGQRTTVSVPRGVGEAALEVTFARRGDTVFVLDRDTVVGSIH